LFTLALGVPWVAMNQKQGNCVKVKTENTFAKVNDGATQALTITVGTKRLEKK
jgi:hypothetical protein